MKPEDYIKGDRMGSEARQLERRAMDDPFLWDALAGYEAVPGDHADALGRLRGRVAARTRRRLSGARIWTVAASLLLFLGVGGYLVVRMQPREEPMLTLATEESLKSVATVGQDDLKQELPITDVVKFSPPTVTMDCQVVEECCAQMVMAAPEAEKVAVIADQVAVEQVIDAQAVVREVAKATVAYEGAKQQDQIITTGFAAMMHKSFGGAAPTANMVSGVVRDSAGNALPGAIVAVKDAKRSVIADAKGCYSLDAAPGSKLNFSSIGYLSQQITVSQPVHDVIMTARPETLAEVVVKGRSAKGTSRIVDIVTSSVAQHDSSARMIARMEKQAELTPSRSEATLQDAKIRASRRAPLAVTARLDSLKDVTARLDSLKDVTAAQTVKPRPVGGMRAYKKYLKENLVRPAGCVCSKDGGKVILDFDTDASGRPVHIRVVGSPCPACDREAARLLRNGPRWTPCIVDGRIEMVFRAC